MKYFIKLTQIFILSVLLIGCSANVSNNGDELTELRPVIDKTKPYAFLQGKITDISGKPISAAMKINDLTARDSVGHIHSNSATGAYSIDLELGKNYGIFIDKKGFFPTSINIDLEKNTKTTELREDIVLFTVDDLKNKDLPIQISNIFFETGKSVLKPESFPELNRLANILQGIPGIKVEISGHTDNTGRAEINLDISRKRAQAVVDYLISKGCEKYNLTAKGYGSKKPLVTNNNEENRAKNRRVEFRIIK